MTKLKPVVVKPLIVSKYAFVKRSNGFTLLNTLFQINGIIRNSGNKVNVTSKSQRDVLLSNSLRSQKELKIKPAAKDKKHVATKLLTACSSPFWSPTAIGRIKNRPVI